ncbi:unnamed protein product, partial [Ilex paraguariensis]
NPSLPCLAHLVLTPPLSTVTLMPHLSGRAQCLATLSPCSLVLAQPPTVPTMACPLLCDWWWLRRTRHPIVSCPRCQSGPCFAYAYCTFCLVVARCLANAHQGHHLVDALLSSSADANYFSTISLLSDVNGLWLFSSFIR